MKKQIIFFAGIVLAVTAVLIACSKSDHKNAINSSNSKKNNLKSASHSGEGFPFPEGTVFIENNSVIDFQLPSGSIIYGFDTFGQMVSGVKGSITCKCDGSGGCKPFAAGGKTGCLVDGCASCTGKTSLTGLTEAEFFLIRKGEATENSALAFLSESRPVYNIEEWIQLPFAGKNDVESTTFQQALQELNNYIDENFARTNMVAIPFIHDGKKVIVDVPFESVESGMLYSLSVSAGGYSCSGACGASKCKKETAAMGQVVYCDGCQSGCKLTSSYMSHY